MASDTYDVPATNCQRLNVRICVAEWNLGGIYCQRTEVVNTPGMSILVVLGCARQELRVTHLAGTMGE